MTTRECIRDFLASKRLAVIGVSHAPKDFTRTLFQEFAKRAYDVVPVNPGLEEVEGRRCYARVQEIAPAVEGALIMTRPATTEKVVRDCAEAGIRRVWLYRAAGADAVSPEAVKFCESRGIEVIAGYCPFMFFPNAGSFHGLHAFLLKITGRYPG
jgi:predicted CoA-binding protein